MKDQEIREAVQAAADLATKPFLSRNEVCRLLDLSESCVDNMIREGLIPARRIGRKKIVVLRKDIDALIENSEPVKTLAEIPEAPF